MMDPHSSHAEIARKRELYRGELEKHGHSLLGRDIPMARLLAVAETREEAEKTARQARSGWWPPTSTPSTSRWGPQARAS